MRIHYHLVYGTRHYKGLEVFKKTEAVAIPYMHECRAAAQRRRDEAKSKQTFLLAESETYRERRFRTFNERRRRNARSAVICLLNRETTTSYQTLFEESMQFSTVVEADLREWLEEWRADNRIQYLNWKIGQKVPHLDTLVSKLQYLS